jgi:hypothetical protein
VREWPRRKTEPMGQMPDETESKGATPLNEPPTCWFVASCLWPGGNETRHPLSLHQAAQGLLATLPYPAATHDNAPDHIYVARVEGF